MASFSSGRERHLVTEALRGADSRIQPGFECDFGLFRCSFVKNGRSFGRCCAVYNDGTRLEWVWRNCSGQLALSLSFSYFGPRFAAMRPWVVWVWWRIAKRCGSTAGRALRRCYSDHCSGFGPF